MGTKGIDIDIKEDEIQTWGNDILEELLIDHTTGKNIIWATDNYKYLGKGYDEWDIISPESITGKNGLVLRPRVNKSKEEQEHRSRDKAEVFTSAWICNKQNNLIDIAWFETESSPFNTETEQGWITKHEKVSFPKEKTWQDYVKDTRLEMACGEAPYLVSRYNVVTGEGIDVKDRIGLLDRKLRIVSENTSDESEWFEWAIIAYQNTYGFEWQGDNLLLAREALLYTFRDYYSAKFGKMPTTAQILNIAKIVSWNIWQMDGLKGVVPGSCHEQVNEVIDLFGESSKTIIPCKGCQTDDIYKHNGKYCLIKDWENGKKVRFIDLLNK